MAAPLPDIIRYFLECYRSDNRDLVIYDFLDKKIEHKVYVEGKEELANGEMPIIPLDKVTAVNILKKLQLYRKEKELLYGTFFVCGGYRDFRGEEKRLCAPLFYYPAEVTKREEDFYLSILPEERRLNFPLISLLAGDSDINFATEPLFNTLSQSYAQFQDAGILVKICEKYFDNCGAEEAYLYPSLTPVSKIRRKITQLRGSGENRRELLPFSMAGVVSKSSNTRGVLNELEQLADSHDFSAPLSAMFYRAPLVPAEQPEPGRTPVILSRAQQQIVKAAATQTLSLIIGPPGTGKTYTIGAIAMEHLNRGESVLIASRTDEAVDVIADKIAGQISTRKFMVRAGRKRKYQTPLNRFLSAILTRASPVNYLARLMKLGNIRDAGILDDKFSSVKRALGKTHEKIRATEEQLLKHTRTELEWGEHLSREKHTLWGKLKTEYMGFRNDSRDPLWHLTANLLRLDEEYLDLVSRFMRMHYVRQVLKAVKDHYPELESFRAALKTKSDTEKLALFDQIDFAQVLRAFPVWLVNLSELKDALPLQKEMFDVAIVDEATQCDMASCLPLLQRARRVVFAGDPAQLRHVSFLSGSIQAMLRRKFSLEEVEPRCLNYRDLSVLDMVRSSLQSKEQVNMLDEHFRSHPAIIAFSNRTFYDNELRVMRSRPDATEKGLYIIPCQGTRDGKGINTQEADRIIADIAVIIENETHLGSNLCTSIGILSPFRAQADQLAKMVADRFSLTQIEKHSLRVGTAYGFQGEERDHMYISMAIDPDSHHSAMVHLNKEDVFNVAITRARDRQFVYTSLNIKDLKKDTLLHKFLNQEHANAGITEVQEVHDDFLLEVKEAIQKMDIDRLYMAYSIAGLSIDLLVKRGDTYTGVNLVGYPGSYVEMYDMERYRILGRAGISILPLPYSKWFFDQKNTVAAIENILTGSK